MTIAIRIGASSTAYSDLNGAYAAAIAAKQKLSITGTGEEIKNELTTLFGNGSAGAIDNFNTVSKTIGSIKATNDLNLDTTEVGNYKAALVKLGSKSIVLNSQTTSTQLADKFNELDAVYTKVKSITLSDANDATPVIAVGKLATAINMGGLETLTGKKFSVSGTATDIKTNMDSMLKNISRIDKIVINADAKVDAKSATAVTTNAGHGFNTGEAITYNGTTDPGNLVRGTTYFARKLTDTTYAVYDSYEHAVAAPGVTTGIIDTSGATLNGVFTSNVATEFTTKQLGIVGEKLVKTHGAQVVLKDTADTLLATSSLALINKLNNTNINTAAVTATTTGLGVGGISTTKFLDASDGHGFKTGDKVHFNPGGTAAGDLTLGNDYYVRVKNGTQFNLYGSYDEAVANYGAGATGDTNANTFALNAIGVKGTFTSIVGPNPFRTTTLDSVKVTGATLNQADRFVTLSALNNALSGPGAGNRLMSNIVSSIEIADTVTNLNKSSPSQTQAMTSYTNTATDNIFTKAGGHGYKTGDAVTYSVASGGTKITALTEGATYYVGKKSDTEFALFTSRTLAKNADYTSTTTLAATSLLLAGGTGVQKFSVTDLSRTISDVTRLNGDTAKVGRVTIKGSGEITSLELSDIAKKVNAGSNSVAQITYSAKAVDIQNNMQALYDNQHAANMTGITEIVVNDGTSKGKKALTLSDTYFQVLRDIFKEGVDKHESPTPVLAKNYTFNVTGASYSRLTTPVGGAPLALQDEMDVGSFAITGVQASDLKVSSVQLATDLGKSKLKTMTTDGISSADRSIIQGLLNSVGSGSDRAKLKLVNQL